MRYELADIGKARGNVPLDFSNLKPGDTAKMMFDWIDDEGRYRSESMWVEVTRGNAGRYVGELRNESCVDHASQYGDEVIFEARHVIDVFR